MLRVASTRYAISSSGPAALFTPRLFTPRNLSTGDHSTEPRRFERGRRLSETPHRTTGSD